MDSLRQIAPNGSLSFYLQFGKLTVVWASDTRARIHMDGESYAAFRALLEGLRSARCRRTTRGSVRRAQRSRADPSCRKGRESRSPRLWTALDTDVLRASYNAFVRQVAANDHRLRPDPRVYGTMVAQ